MRGGMQSSQSLNDEACALMSVGAEEELYWAEDALRRALGLQPTNAAALCNYGRLLQRQGRDPGLAGDMFAKAARLRPEPAILSSYALFLEDSQRDLARAQEVYEKALQLHPSDTLLLHNLAQLLRSRAGEGRKTEASEGVDKGRKTTHSSAQQAWDVGRAKSLFERVLDIAPNAAESLNGLGCLLLDSGNYSGARERLEKALSLEPNNPTTCCNLAMLEYKDGRDTDHASAVQLYRRAVDLDPSHDVALCNLSDLLRRSEDTRAEAYACLERALEQSPDNIHGRYCTVRYGAYRTGIAAKHQHQIPNPNSLNPNFETPTSKR